MFTLLACMSRTEATGGGDARADTERGDTGADTAESPPFDCTQPPDPDRGMEIAALMARLESQRCLGAEDIAAVEAFMSERYAQSTVYCDVVYRMSSPDGLVFDGPSERVIEHASVPDVVITDSGEHVVVYNDVTPGRLVELLRSDPERFWRQGLLGWGGMGMSVGSAESSAFEEVADLDLNLERLMRVVDPDLGRKPDGAWHAAWFGIQVEDGMENGALHSNQPHKFFRGSSADLRTFGTPVVAAASTEGSTGGADPTILDLADGGEILYVGPLDNTALGWSSPDGVTWNAEGGADVDSQVPTATPDAMADPRGDYRMHYMRNGDFGNFEVARSKDGRVWESGATMIRTQTGFNLSVARGPDGVWWLYYNETDPDCM